MLVGYRLQRLRKKRKITQKVLAEKAGISRSYLADIEHNRYNPSLDTIEALASALKLDLKSFFDDALLEKSFYLKPLSEESSHEEIEEISENEIIEKEIEAPYEVNTLSKKELRNIGDDLGKTLEYLNNFEKDLVLDGAILDLETRKLLRDSLENSMKMAKVIAKSKFAPKTE